MWIYLTTIHWKMLKMIYFVLRGGFFFNHNSKFKTIFWKSTLLSRMLQPTLQSITSEIIHNPNPPTRSSLVAQRVKRLPAIQETWVRSLGEEDPLEKEMATHSSTLAWKIPQTEKPGRLQSMGSQSRTRLSDFTIDFTVYKTGDSIHFAVLQKLTQGCKSTLLQ